MTGNGTPFQDGHAGMGRISPPPAGQFQTGERRRRNAGDFLFKHLTLFFAIVVFSLIFLMAYEMYTGAKPTMASTGWRFLTGTTWDPVQDIYGALPFLFGTLVTSLFALALALPLSIGVAVFLSELAPRWVERPLSFMVELLAAIPSIAYGLWGIFVLVPWLQLTVEPFLIDHLGFIPLFRGTPYGFGMLAAGLLLTIMVVPIITAITRDVLHSIPHMQREAALGLGATRWETTKIILQQARSGILGATLLGLGRAVGETMAVTMVIGNRPGISASLLDPGHSMASVIANEFAEASTTLYTSALIEIALILFVLTIALNALARLVVWSVSRRFSPS